MVNSGTRGHVSGMTQGELHNIRCRRPEAGLTVRQIKPPGANEALIETLCAHGRLCRVEALMPLTQRRGIIIPEGVACIAQQPCLSERLVKAVWRGQHAAREDVFLDEIDALAVGLPTLVGEGDHLKCRLSAGLEALADLVEIDRPVFLAHRLEHLDRGDAVIAAGFVAVILKLERHLVGKTSLFNAFNGILVLFLADRQAGHIQAARPGGFAEYAAKERGLKVTGLTISQEQHDYAVERMERAGLSDKVDIKLQDYRDEKGLYDGIASIEMFEAVGEKYWPVYFETVRARLKPGRRATLQIITVEDHRFETYRKGVDFIQKYIFPGGMLPSPSVLRSEIEKAGLNVMKSIEFGESYSQTLRRWHDTFNERWSEISLLGFDDRFKRMWNFYLTSCAAGFHAGSIDVTQITVTKPG